MVARGSLPLVMHRLKESRSFELSIEDKRTTAQPWRPAMRPLLPPLVDAVGQLREAQFDTCVPHIACANAHKAHE